MSAKLATHISRTGCIRYCHANPFDPDSTETICEARYKYNNNNNGNGNGTQIKGERCEQCNRGAESCDIKIYARQDGVVLFSCDSCIEMARSHATHPTTNRRKRRIGINEFMKTHADKRDGTSGNLADSSIAKRICSTVKTTTVSETTNELHGKIPTEVKKSLTGCYARSGNETGKPSGCEIKESDRTRFIVKAKDLPPRKRLKMVHMVEQV
jgi:hypothetical protein